jgi:hypothetical protein
LPRAEALADPAKGASAEDLTDFGRETLAALVQSQTAVARGLEALSAEWAGLARSGIDAAAHAATGMLAVKTFSQAIEVNAGFTRSGWLAIRPSCRNSGQNLPPRLRSQYWLNCATAG